MNGRPRTSSPRSTRPRWRRRGLTLVEVVAGLAILGTLLATVLVARGRHLHQLALAQRKQAAIAAADALLAEWFNGTSAFPRDQQGEVMGDVGLQWRTIVLPEQLDPAFDAEKVRLEIVDTRVAGDGGQTAPLVTVEVVLAKPAPSGDTHP